MASAAAGGGASDTDTDVSPPAKKARRQRRRHRLTGVDTSLTTWTPVSLTEVSKLTHANDVGEIEEPAKLLVQEFNELMDELDDVELWDSVQTAQRCLSGRVGREGYVHQPPAEANQGGYPLLLAALLRGVDQMDVRALVGNVTEFARLRTDAIHAFLKHEKQREEYKEKAAALPGALERYVSVLPPLVDVTTTGQEYVWKLARQYTKYWRSVRAKAANRLEDAYVTRVTGYFPADLIKEHFVCVLDLPPDFDGSLTKLQFVMVHDAINSMSFLLSAATKAWNTSTAEKESKLPGLLKDFAMRAEIVAVTMSFAGLPVHPEFKAAATAVQADTYVVPEPPVTPLRHCVPTKGEVPPKGVGQVSFEEYYSTRELALLFGVTKSFRAGNMTLARNCARQERAKKCVKDGVPPGAERVKLVEALANATAAYTAVRVALDDTKRASEAFTSLYTFFADHRALAGAMWSERVTLRGLPTHTRDMLLALDSLRVSLGTRDVPSTWAALVDACIGGGLSAAQRSGLTEFVEAFKAFADTLVFAGIGRSSATCTYRGSGYVASKLRCPISLGWAFYASELASVLLHHDTLHDVSSPCTERARFFQCHRLGYTIETIDGSIGLMPIAHPTPVYTSVWAHDVIRVFQAQVDHDQVLERLIVWYLGDAAAWYLQVHWGVTLDIVYTPDELCALPVVDDDLRRDTFVYNIVAEKLLSRQGALGDGDGGEGGAVIAAVAELEKKVPH